MCVCVRVLGIASLNVDPAKSKKSMIDNRSISPLTNQGRYTINTGNEGWVGIGKIEDTGMLRQ